MMNKQMLAILKTLNQKPDVIVGSRELSRQLKLLGLDLTERTVRYHMKMLDDGGYTQVFGKEGRRITDKGREELTKAQVSGRVGFIISKIETLSFQTDFDLETERGAVILNISFFPEAHLTRALKIMRPVFSSPYVMSDRVMIARGGQKIGDVTVPVGMVGIGTVCSVTINGIFLKVGIPVASKFGGLLEVEDNNPTRFIALISYEGSSLDPLVVFIRSRMTAVNEASTHATGKVLASFREIPVVSLDKAMRVRKRLQDIGIGGILFIGNPNQPLFEMPVGIDRVGMVVVGGLNPVAALEEAGISTENTAMASLIDYSLLLPFGEAAKGIS